MRDFRAKAVVALARDGVGVLVTVVDERGSVPREVGAQMLVTASGFLGSIGGGALEWKAMAEAQSLISSFPRTRESRLSTSSPFESLDSRVRGNDGLWGGVKSSTKQYTLGPDLGQCCGGQVQLRLETFSDATALSKAITIDPPARRIALYGGGHVGRALILVLAQSEFDVTWVDPRPDAFPTATPSNVALYGGEPLQPLAQASIVIVMSHSHALDFDVTDAALRLPNVDRVMLIGSATKRARFLSRLRAAGHGEARLRDLICPIGDGIVRSKKPYAIAISTVQQVLALDEALRLPQTEAARYVRA